MSISAASTANREQARRSDGKFGTQTHAEQGQLAGPSAAAVRGQFEQAHGPEVVRAYEIRTADIEQAQVEVSSGDLDSLWDKTLEVAGSRRGPKCHAHHGRWGYDAACEVCTAGGVPKPIPDNDDPQYWREQAEASARRSYESFQRCDTDGFMSQWAGDMMSQQHHLQARIAENGGEWPTLTLFRADTEEPIEARLVRTRYGQAWVYDDENGNAVWVNPSNARSAEKRKETMAKKGYREGYVWMAARAELNGENATSLRAVVKPRWGRPRAECEFAGGDSDDGPDV